MNRDWMPEESWLDLRQRREVYLFSTAFRLVMKLLKPPIQCAAYRKVFLRD
jgi:hypothetical protein